MEGIHRFRHNAINISTISAFENIKGGINDACKDVYFVRAVGANASYLEDIKKLDENLMGLMNQGKGYYHRINELARLTEVEAVEFYSECYLKWADSDKKQFYTKATKKSNALATMMGNACREIEIIYRQGNHKATDSMIKNLIVKLAFWYDTIFDNEIFSFNERESFKIVASNIEKKQEYLFFYLLTLMGCDVLLLQSNRDIAEDDERMQLSAKFVLGDATEVSIPKYFRHTVKAAAKVSPGAVENTTSVEQVRPRINLADINRRGQERRTGEPVEKSFEELALLASSVVLIAIHDNQGKVIGTGSGIMIGRGGYILTNNHVASGGRFYSVRIEDDEQVYETDEVIKYNQLLDLAIIRIQRNLNPLKVYNGSRKLVRGQKVVAIGSPLGLFNSVSDGIISGFRTIDTVDMIQFTAPTSHGSSGGAVLNMYGEVIGISTAGFSDGQNINLAMGYECINAFIRGFTG